jgi:hypothetical protein
MFVTNMFGHLIGKELMQLAPISRREPPAKKALSREAIVEAALAILTEEGADALTMRRLAAALDTGIKFPLVVDDAPALAIAVVDR